MNKIDVRELLYELRGTPDKCDFCGKAVPADDLEPEEAGDWVCHDCLARWEAQESSGDQL